MLKVLIAMTSELLAQQLALSLTQYDLHICHTGKEALAKIESLHPDILLLDLMLPDSSGIQLLETSSFKPRIILAFTDFVNDEVLLRAAGAGIREVILIPCSLRHVLRHLDALIENAHLAES